MIKLSMFALAVIILLLPVLTACVRNTGDPAVTTTADSAATTAEPTTTTAELAVTTEPTTTTAEPEVTTDAGQNDELDRDKAYSVLFIGNSYTYYNSMPDIFAKIAEAAGYNVKVSSVTKGGYFLRQFADPTDEYGKQVLAMLNAYQYDYIFLQEQSFNAVGDPGTYFSSVRSLCETIKSKQTDAKVVLYETWGYKTGHSKLSFHGLTTTEMEMKQRASYTAIADELGLRVSYAGAAMAKVFTEIPQIELYNDDKTHPSYAGSLMVAYTHFATVFGVDPKTLSFNGTLPENITAILKSAADYASGLDQITCVDAAYRISSVGVVGKTQANNIDYTKTKNPTAFPGSQIISVISGTYGTQNFSGIRGTNDKIAATDYSTTQLSAEQKTAIADIGNGVSVVGIDHMVADSKGYTTAVENLVNGHWGSSYMAAWVFDDEKYGVDGTASESGKYTGLITLNFGKKMKFDALCWFSGSLEGFPGAAETYVSDDGVNWTLVPTACWDQINGPALVNAGTSPADPWNGNTSKVSCLFGMEGVTGQYIRVGVSVGRNDTVDMYNTINTRELAVYGSEISG